MSTLDKAKCTSEKVFPAAVKGHYTMTKEQVHQEDIIIPSMYVPDNRAPNVRSKK